MESQKNNYTQNVTESDFQNFKCLLEYFLTHIQYCLNSDPTPKGFDKYIKPLQKDFKKTGRDIIKQIEEWNKIGDYKINIHVVGGTPHPYKDDGGCYLNIDNTNISVQWSSKYEEPEAFKLYTGKYYNGEFFKDKEISYTLKELELFTKEDSISEKIKDFCKEFIDMATKMLREKHILKLRDYTDIITVKKNLILQGAPGTGKTYSTASIALKILGYEDKVIENPNSGQPKADFLDRASLIRIYNSLLIKKFIGVDNCKKGEKYDFSKLGEIADDDERQIAFVTFHQSMDYEDFIEGIKPVSINDGKDVAYPVKSGIFKAIANKAKENPDKNYVLIIDEINRGNVSKIFGELITLLEADKRTYWSKKEKESELDVTKNPNSIKVILPYSQEEFSVPSNLYIIGTMNTTDRSAGSLDYAIRRRFAFVTLPSDENVIEGEVKDNALKAKSIKLFQAVNSFIKNKKQSDMDLDDLMIGHSYFLAKDEKELEQKWKYEILPLLMEYYKDGLLTESPIKDGKDPNTIRASYAAWIDSQNEESSNENTGNKKASKTEPEMSDGENPSGEKKK